jgi:hypothetical protein
MLWRLLGYAVLFARSPNGQTRPRLSGVRNLALLYYVMTGRFDVRRTGESGGRIRDATVMTQFRDYIVAELAGSNLWIQKTGTLDLNAFFSLAFSHSAVTGA